MPGTTHNDGAMQEHWPQHTHRLHPARVYLSILYVSIITATVTVFIKKFSKSVAEHCSLLIPVNFKSKLSSSV